MRPCGSSGAEGVSLGARPEGCKESDDGEELRLLPAVRAGPRPPSAQGAVELQRFALPEHPHLDLLVVVIAAEHPEGVLEEVTRLWQSCLQILAEVVQQGIDEGTLAPRDPWEVANVLWTLANGLIQGEASPPHRRIRKRPLAETFVSAIDLVLAGLAPPR